MTSRRIAGLCWSAGGAVWAARWLLALSPSVTGVARYAGLALLGAGLMIAGAGLVKRDTPWLRAVAGVGAAGLVWSVVEVFRPAGEAQTFDGATGILAVVVGLLVLSSGRARAPKRPAGAHAR